MRYGLLLVLAALLLPAPLPVLAREPAGSAAALHARRAELRSALRDSPFGEPLVIRSRQSNDRIEGEVHAEIAHPFDVVASALRTPAALCEMLLLHPNVHGCAPREGGVLELLAGPKKSGGAGLTAQMRYTLRSEVDAGEHLRVVLSAPRGPLSTTDYRMVFEAVAIDARSSFVHFDYSHGTGALARMAMASYLATAGRDKIGFSISGRDANGKPQFVRGERGSLERNAMRYYLALVAHCRERSGSAEQRAQARLRTWFALTERHAAQLHEYSLEEYLAEKQRDLAHGSTQK